MSRTMISVIDTQTFNSVRNALGDEAFAATVNRFNKETAQLLQQLIGAVSQNDTNGINLISSKIKAASQQLGAARLMSLAGQIGVVTSFQSALNAMQQEYYQVVRWLNEHYLPECA